MSDSVAGDHMLSRDGVRNAYHLRCDVVGHARPYAVCAHLCEQSKKGDLSPIYAECENAIRRERCPALSMIDEERVLKKPLYFVERIKGVAEKLRQAFKWENASPNAPDYNKSVVSEVESMNFADALNASEKRTIQVESVEQREGESLIEMAKRIAAKRKETA